MPRHPRLALALAALAAAVAVPALVASPAHARDGGTGSRAELRLRGDGEEIRLDARVRTAKRGVWRVSVFHERRLVARARVRSTRSGRGFEYRAFLPDYEGPDAVRVRGVAPGGETCTAAATLTGS